jgi:hypothetical protein
MPFARSWPPGARILPVGGCLLTLLAAAVSIIATQRAAPSGSPHFFLFGPLATSLTALTYGLWSLACMAPNWRSSPASHRVVTILPSAVAPGLLIFALTRI